MGVIHSCTRTTDDARLSTLLSHMCMSQLQSDSSASSSLSYRVLLMPPRIEALPARWNLRSSSSVGGAVYSIAPRPASAVPSCVFGK